MNIIDFTLCPLSPRNLEYGGRAGEKRGILFEGANWILKFPKTTNGMRKVEGLSYVTSPLSEYIGSHVYEILGYDVHKTKLGICFDGQRNKVVCACKDFIENPNEELLIPYTALRNDTNEDIMAKRDSSSFSASNLNEIVFQLEHNTILRTIPNATQRFWDCAIIDLLINNNDRNEDNWGVIKNRVNSSYRLAPVFDCGNSFYGKASEERVAQMLIDEAKLLSSAVNGVTAYEDDEERRIRNLEILQWNNPDLQEAIKRVYELAKARMDVIFAMMDEVPDEYEGLPIFTEARKTYYKETFRLRFSELLEKAYLAIK